MDRGQITLAFNLQNELNKAKIEMRTITRRMAELPDEIYLLEGRLSALGLPPMPPTS